MVTNEHASEIPSKLIPGFGRTYNLRITIKKIDNWCTCTKSSNNIITEETTGSLCNQANTSNFCPFRNFFFQIISHLSLSCFYTGDKTFEQQQLIFYETSMPSRYSTPLFCKEWTINANLFHRRIASSVTCSASWPVSWASMSEAATFWGGDSCIHKGRP